MNRSVSGITKRNKRSIRDINRKGNEQDQQSVPENNGKGSGQEPGKRPPEQRDGQRAARFGLWFIAVVAILFIFFVFSVVFAETTVTVHPETAAVSIDNTYTATANTATNTEALSYSIFTLENTASAQVTASETAYRESEANGEITIYNEFSEETIQLVNNTRFAAPNGNIYRIREPVTVPGQSIDEPGTVTVQVYADEPGSEYNTNEPIKFSIPGFSGTPQEGEVYARSAGNMTGGVAGQIPIVSSSTRASIQTEIGGELENQLRNRLANELPEGLTTYNNAVFFSTEILPAETSGTSTATVRVRGTLRAVTFDTRELSAFLGRASGEEIEVGTNVRILDLSDFTFNFIDRQSFSPETSNSFDFRLAGDSVLVWQYNEEALARDLRSLQKDRLDDVLVNYENIEEATVTTRPFWKRSLPAEAEEIDIRTVVR